MVEMTKKNVSAYLSNYLPEGCLPPTLVKRLLEISFDSTMVLDIVNCK